MVLSFPGMGTSPPDEGDTQDVTVTLSLRFSATKKVRKSFDTEDEYGAYLRELELGTKNQAERHQTFTMPPASRWTAADLDRLLVATLQFINETAAMPSDALSGKPTRSGSVASPPRGDASPRNT